MLTAVVVSSCAALLWLHYRSLQQSAREARALRALNLHNFFSADEGYHGLEGTTIAVDHATQLIGVWHRSTGPLYYDREGIYSVQLTLVEEGEVRHQTHRILGRYILGRVVGGPSLGEVAGLTSRHSTEKKITSIVLELHIRDSHNPLVRIGFYRGPGVRQDSTVMDAARRWKAIAESLIR